MYTKIVSIYCTLKQITRTKLHILGLKNFFHPGIREYGNKKVLQT